MGKIYENQTLTIALEMGGGARWGNACGNPIQEKRSGWKMDGISYRDNAQCRHSEEHLNERDVQDSGVC